MNHMSELCRRTLMLTVLLTSISFGLAVAKAGRHQLQFTVNGVTFGYDLTPVRGDCNIFEGRSAHLSAGQYVIPFTCLTDKPLLRGVGRTRFSGSITRVKNPNVTVDNLLSDTRPGGEAEGMFFPNHKPSRSEFEVIESRRWLVITKFDDADRLIPLSRVYWTVQKELLITVNVNIDQRSSRSSEWRKERLQQLETLVRRFSISHI